jgi:hypothetical protein
MWSVLLIMGACEHSFSMCCIAAVLLGLLWLQDFLQERAGWKEVFEKARCRQEAFEQDRQARIREFERTGRWPIWS